MAFDRQFHSLEDYLTSTMSDVDGVLDDGGGAGFPVKGREIEATVLFADITGFSTRTLSLSPAATLIFVQNFFAWITAEALDGRPGIVDKYIGDEVMVVFSAEFGSVDPFADAVQAAAAMSRHDPLAYQPHIGIASGPVIVGYAGTAFRYNVSVFGEPVALAARCAAVKPDDLTSRVYSNIVMPAVEWGERDLSVVVPPAGDESTYPRFELQGTRDVPMKGLGTVSVREIYNTSFWTPSISATDRAEAGLKFLQANGRYWPR
ncbi:adenylate/guanylate cyclase domain-containing protein [Rhodococcus sp. IEGM 1318]|uniref:adenylate/guanylate cyclase domain-containing protein n=1 Tax=Rhodococcus sp. IEGM 1318 TaxID=3082226 RepID=UPI0029554214|nr:adenylate/guanylate cyclase domain-containing protein [Rhodococcus sp. IEGM 1318]MDV8008952.1 adenylate/guanylate cyclase domain-containing protein [Rhodococcus sp. IEGM 1318]